MKRSCRSNRLLMRRTMALAGPYFQRVAPGVCAKATPHLASPGSPGFFPWDVSFVGLGWERIAIRTLQYSLNITTNPEVVITPFVPGRTYRIIFQSSFFSGPAPTVRMRLGSDTIDMAVLTLNAAQQFDQICGSDNNQLRFIVDDNTTTNSATIVALSLEDITP